MSTFKENKNVSDRSGSDRQRHKDKIDKAIKEGIHDIVADESIIGKDGKKKIKIPVKGIKEYRFVYGDNENKKNVGSAHGKDIQRGQRVGQKGSNSSGQPNKAGNEKGEEFYEVEITLEELAAYLFDEFKLPNMQKKKFKSISSKSFKRHGYRNEGIRPRLDKKETIKKKIKRKKKAIKNNTFDPKNDERFGFHHDDLRYRFIKEKKKPTSNAAIFFIMDVSGSMTKEKKFLARSFFFLLYHFVRSKYENTEHCFISHDTTASEVNEEDFFGKGSTGGTLVSTGLDKCLDVIETRYHPSTWNVYVFQCSDGDNWPEDNDGCFQSANKLAALSQFYGYCEIEPMAKRGAWLQMSNLSELLAPLVKDNFKIAEIRKKDDIWLAFQRFFGGFRE
tara:strand:- start:1895 stop:3067 length:1173 start_codon:yes stop_codon:yes gene_type:complete